MTVVITYLAKDNAKSRYRARRAAKREQASEDMRLARQVATAASGCSLNVSKAVNAPTVRSKPEPSADNLCLGDVAIYSAGFRKKSESVTAR